MKKDCDCIKNIEIRLKEKYPEYENIRAETIVTFPKLKTFPFMNITYEEKLKNGKMKKKKLPVIATYCMFCGKKYE